MEDVKKKINNLRSQFSHEYNKVHTGGHSGEGRDDVYEPSVWWYEKLLFLTAYIKPRKSHSTLSTLSQVQVEETQSLQDSQEEESQEILMEFIPEDTSTSCETVTNITKTPKKRYAQDQTSNNEKIVGKTMEALDILGKRLKTAPAPTSIKQDDSQFQIFANYVAKELEQIENEELLNDAKHAIHNIIYETQKKWVALKKTPQDLYVVTNYN